MVKSNNKDNGLWAELWIITDYHEGVYIYDYLSENTISPVEAVKMFYIAVCGFEHMHKEIASISDKHGMAHCDGCIGDQGLG